MGASPIFARTETGYATPPDRLPGTCMVRGLSAAWEPQERQRPKTCLTAILGGDPADLGRDLVSGGRVLVPRRGFDPLISTLKGWRPTRLDDRGTQLCYYKQRDAANIPWRRGPNDAATLSLTVAGGAHQHRQAGSFQGRIRLNSVKGLGCGFVAPPQSPPADSA